MQIWENSLQRERQKHSKWPKVEGKVAQKLLKFHHVAAFYMAFSEYFFLEGFGRKTRFVKYIYHINKSQSDVFRDKINGYALA